MAEQQRTDRGCLSQVVFLVLGITIRGGAGRALYSGHLTPLYYKFDWDAAHQEHEDGDSAIGAIGAGAVTVFEVIKMVRLRLPGSSLPAKATQ